LSFLEPFATSWSVSHPIATSRRFRGSLVTASTSASSG
jgi:hypothetical protein